MQMKERIENGFLIKEFDASYAEMPEGFDQDIDMYITCHPSKREPFAKNMPVKIYCKGVLVYSD